MPTVQSSVRAGEHSAAAVKRIGCVSFLNAKPLIDGLDDRADAVDVAYDVPSALLGELQAARVDIALCPVIDFYRSSVPLEIVPVGGIGCEGSTLTVKLCSRVPMERITAMHADTDSHTSVALLQIVLAERFGVRPDIVDYRPQRDVGEGESVLLIGDKVVTDSPSEKIYPHQLDLGEAWLEQTAMPFVFAVWMARSGSQLGDLPDRLATRRIKNAARIDQIAERHAPLHHWPVDLAKRYLGQLLRFEIGPRELEVMDIFARKAYDLGLIDELRPLRVRR